MTRYFFLTPDEQRARIAEVSREIDLSFVSNWPSSSAELDVCRWEEIPDLGLNKTGRILGAGWYTVFRGSPNFELKSLETVKGIHFSIDLETVKSCFTIAFCGMTNDLQKIVVGSISCEPRIEGSKRFFTEFSRTFLKGCSKDKIGDYWGPEALRLSAQSVR